MENNNMRPFEYLITSILAWIATVVMTVLSWFVPLGQGITFCFIAAFSLIVAAVSYEEWEKRR